MPKTEGDMKLYKPLWIRIADAFMLRNSAPFQHSVFWISAMFTVYRHELTFVYVGIKWIESSRLGCLTAEEN